MRIMILPSAIFLTLSLAACQPGDADTNLMGDRDQTDYQQTRYGDEDTQMNRNGQYNNMNNTTQNTNQNNQGTRDYDVAEEVADEITDQVDEVERAYVLTGQNNAYVTVVLHNNNNDDEINDRTKEEVAQAVQSEKDDIENVYVSANPDLRNMMDDYATKVRQGDPVEGFFEEFNQMIERVFPNLER
ncbi:YhcN/YlaJ family sporulation lipoprotein [Halalkalibacillus halophilus]|uniref:YhcN/YlaJ family sporulation lipoprotein n=1 Tax=Halalkalibacillus halophilus TaxID=392827 RepID=UPI0004156D90|nr:YhcN/YlaJ family sporulation lipoprotein [Halalkalibacillus halophilus]